MGSEMCIRDSIYSTGFDPIGGIVDLVNTFLDGGFAGLLALLVFLSFLG